MKDKIVYFLLFSIVLLVTACGKTSTNSVGSSGLAENTGNKQAVYLDDFGVIPLSNTVTQGTFLFRIHNQSSNQYTLDSISIQDSNNQTSKLLSVSPKMCDRINPYSYCSIQFTPQTQKSTDLYMTIKLRSNDDNIKVLHKLIRMSNKLSSNKGIVIDNELQTIVSHSGEFHAAYPFLLERNLDDIAIDNASTIICDNDDYLAGSSCTALIDGTAVSDKTRVSKNAVALDGDDKIEIPGSLIVEKSSVANLSLSHGIVVNDGKTVDILVQNNGNVPADISVDVASPLSRVDVAEADSNVKADSEDKIGICSTVINSNQVCKLQFSVTSEYSGSSVLTLSYSYDSEKGKIEGGKRATLYYIGNEDNPELTITPLLGSNDLTQTIRDTTKSVTYIVKNLKSDRRKINSLSISKQFAHEDIIVDSSDCENFFGNQSCNVIVSYSPKKSLTNDVNNSVIIYASGLYLTRDNVEKQINSTYSINYGTYTRSASSFIISSLIDSTDNSFIWAAGPKNAGHEYKLEIRNADSSSLLGAPVNIIFESIFLTGNNDNNSPVKISDRSTCLNNAVTPQASCTIIIEPSADSVEEFTSTDYGINISYRQYDHTYSFVHDFKVSARLYAAKLEASLIDSENVVHNDTLSFGVEHKAYTYRITNNGSYPAENLVIETNASGELFDFSSQCPRILKATESCFAQLSFNPNKLLNLKAINISYDNLIISNGSLALGVSYTDTENKIKSENLLANLNFSLNRNYLGVTPIESSSITVRVDSANNAEVTIPVKIGSSHNDKILTVQPEINGLSSNLELIPCDIAKGNQSCNVRIIFRSGSVGEFQPVRVELRISNKEDANQPAIHAQVDVVPFLGYFSRPLPVEKLVVRHKTSDSSDEFGFLELYNNSTIYQQDKELPFEITLSGSTVELPASSQLLTTKLGEIQNLQASCTDRVCKITGNIKVNATANKIDTKKPSTQSFQFDLLVTVDKIKRTFSFNAENYLIVSSLNVNTTQNPLNWSEIIKSYNKDTRFFPIKANDINDSFAATQFTKATDSIKNTFYLSTIVKVNANYTDMNSIKHSESKEVNLFASRSRGNGNLCLLSEIGCGEKDAKLQIGTYTGGTISDTPLGGGLLRPIEGYSYGNRTYQIPINSSLPEALPNLLTHNDSLANGNYNATFYMVTAMINGSNISNSELVKVNLNWDKR